MINRHAPRRIVLVGLPGSGKSSIARLIARRLGGGWQVVDVDEDVTAAAGTSIPEIFASQGEAAFRRREREAITACSLRDRIVVSTGGGSVLDRENRRELWRDSFVVQLKARPELLAQRVASLGASPGEKRPLLQGDPLTRLRALAAERGPLYDLADWTVQTDALFPDQVADEIAHVYRHLAEQLVAREGREHAWAADAEPNDGRAATVHAPAGDYPIFTGPGELERLGERMRDAGLKGRPSVVADSLLAGTYGEAAVAALRGSGYDAQLISIASGEQHKHLGTVNHVYDRLIERRAERNDPIVALGGGVTTDLAGYVAATYLRGVPLVQVPTSLLGMVDAAIGGKTGVDHERGKNLIGAFYQPRLVLADTNTLSTLPRRELTGGWAEVIKHALIMDAALLDRMEAEAEGITALEPEPLTAVLQRSAQLKAQVVSADEREGGLRMTLNYGHTIGHGLEAATGFSAVLHGEAVAVGMQGAARLAVRLGVLDQAVADRQRRVLERYGLPLRWPGTDSEATARAMTLDKKVAAQKQRWVLLTDVGSTVIRDDVPAEWVRETLVELLG